MGRRIAEKNGDAATVQSYIGVLQKGNAFTLMKQVVLYRL
jgi:hypothetical protein